MANLSQLRRQRMLAFLEKMREQHKDDDEVLSAINEVENEINEKKYGLVWEEHSEEVEERMVDEVPIFVEDKDKEITMTGNGYNFLLEGDNLHSLHLLEKTHKEKIDVIYIDPPYNTGNGDFIYNDKIIGKEDSFRHSMWISFMERRLSIAKSLLNESGIIFISIDDNEIATLKLLCDAIFGEANLVDILMVEMSNTGGMKVGAAKKGTITKNGEYVLIYAKNRENQEAIRTPLFDSVPGFDTHFNLYIADDGNVVPFTDILLKDKAVVDEFKHFGVNSVDSGRLSLKSLNEYFEKSDILPKFVLEHADRIVRPRSVAKGKWIEYKSSKRKEPYYLTLDDNETVIQLVPMAFNYRQSDDFKPKFGRTVIRGDYWKGFWLDMGNINKEGGVDFKNGKKPIRLIKQLLKWAVADNKEAVVLDFFAGSGTTGQAVLEMSKEDGGNRKFILCTNNENDICDKVTYKRMVNAFEKVPADLKYYHTDFIPKKNDNLVNDLIAHIDEMIQLEYGVKIDKEKYISILSDEDADELEKNWANYPNIKAIYISRSVLLTGKQRELFETHDCFTIPDYYFREELREAGEA